MFIQALQKVFSKPQYVILALVISAVVFAFAVWLPNLPLIADIMRHPGLSFAQKIDVPVSLLASITTNFTAFSAFYTITIALLFGINVAMITYLFQGKVHHIHNTGIATGFFGIMSGAVGIGCAACGSLLLTSLLPFVGATGILAFLPFGGGEFGMLGVVLLAWSLYIISKKIEKPDVCAT